MIKAKQKLLTMRACLFLLVMVSGLALRGIGRELGLPASIVKYGGSVLWATMVLFLIAALAVSHRRSTIGMIAIAVAIIVELSRLLHTPWLDAFRLTPAGALLLGRVFSLNNIVAYTFGVGLGMAVDRLLCSACRSQQTCVKG